MTRHEIIGTSFLMVSEGLMNGMWERNVTLATNLLKQLVVSEVDSPSGGSIPHKTEHEGCYAFNESTEIRENNEAR
jgi:hypothetical protein